jgi:hypothetical protein
MRVVALVCAGLLAVASLGAAVAEQDKVFVCHYTASEANPVVVIHVGKPAENGHLSAPGNGPHNKNSPVGGQDETSNSAVDVADCGGEGGGES